MNDEPMTAQAAVMLATAQPGDTVIVAVLRPGDSMVMHVIGRDPHHMVGAARSLIEQAGDALHERLAEDEGDCQGDHPDEQLLASVLEALEVLPDEMEG